VRPKNFGEVAARSLDSCHDGLQAAGHDPLIGGGLRGDPAMAHLMYFKKIRDELTEVEYLWGPSREQLDSSLVIDKRTFAALPGPPDSPAGQIILRARRGSEWPEVGVIAS
jgi:hypothetical protein